jgi:glycosyltransferase involved in cell wall biosynthesis
MRILILNDYVAYGGAEVYVLRDKKLLEANGHEVFLLTFDEPPSVNGASDRSFIHLPVRTSPLDRILRQLGFARPKRRLRDRVSEVIRRVSPDVIYANNVNKDPLPVFAAIRGHKTLQTLHDYSAVCPLGTCVRPDGSVCGGHAHSDCWVECRANLRKRWRLDLWKKADRARRASVSRFIAASGKLAELCAANGYDVRRVGNPFDLDQYADYVKNTDFGVKKYLYFGAVRENKGIFQLIEAFKVFQAGKPVELLVAGRVASNAEARFFGAIEGMSNVRYLGLLDHAAMLEQLATVHTIVVPSVWMENYPNTVLEGLALEVLVIGSNRGGIAEMLADGRGWTFDVYARDEIVAALEATFRLSENEYARMTAANKDHVRRNNSPRLYYERLAAELREAAAAQPPSA